jgi:hypothetical protein
MLKNPVKNALINTFAVALIGLCFVGTVNGRRAKGDQSQSDSGYMYGYAAGLFSSAFYSVAKLFDSFGYSFTLESIPKPLLQLIVPIHGNILYALLASISFVKLRMGSVKNPNLDRQWYVLELDLHKLKAVETILDQELGKNVLSIYESVKDIPCLEKYICSMA